MIKFKPPTLKTLTSLSLERYVAAIFQTVGYYTDRNLIWKEEVDAITNKSSDILQADILSFSFSPFNESKILIECKGGGIYQDLIKLLGVKTITNPDRTILICNNAKEYKSLYEIGKKNGVFVTKPKDILASVKGISSVEEVNNWYWLNEIEDGLLDVKTICEILGIKLLNKNQKLALTTIRKYNSHLKTQVWKEEDPRIQANLISQLFKTNKSFILKINKIIGGEKTDSETAISNQILCESAASVVLRAKMQYIVTALRCAIASVFAIDDDYLNKIHDEQYRHVVNRLLVNIKTAYRLPAFLQFWIFQFGGVINMNNNEIAKISELLSEKESVIIEYFKILEDIFSILTPIGTIKWSMMNRNGITEFSGIPESFRGFGMNYRTQLGLSIEEFVFKEQWLKRLTKVHIAIN